MTDTPAEIPIHQMSPEQATAELDRMSAQLAGPAPPETPTTPAEANARLTALTESKEWREKYLSGNKAAEREFKALTDLIAAGDALPPGAIETVDAVSDTHAVSRAGYEKLIDGLRDAGLPETAETYIRALDRGERTDRPTEGDGVVCKMALDRLSKNQDWTKKSSPAISKQITCSLH
jgi:hypothetical protein